MFDPELHESDLVAVIDAIAATPELDSKGLDRILKRHPKAGVGLFSRAELIAGYRHFSPGLAEARGWEVDEASWLARLRLRPVRTMSGVTPVTVLTAPWPCPGQCIFCPSDARMPKSYLADEPGAQRAEDNDFDPYRQTWSRLEAYRNIGHPVDKVELIVLGGTWSFLPESYQVWFAKGCFDALNDFGRGVDRRAAAAAIRHGRSLVDPTRAAEWSELEASQRTNELAACRCVGLALETRPDHITSEEVLRLRRLGTTKVQIGIQSLSDRVLEANRRGHDLAATRRALRALRGAGFKIHAHWMPNLLGASPDSDIRDFARLWGDADFRPDELKIYPCSLIESAPLMRYYERGEWQPYATKELVRVLQSCLAAVPPWCRVTRVIRDFSANDIAAGNRVGNLREVAEAALRAAGGACRDIRAREIRSGEFDPTQLEGHEIEYDTSLGREIFLEFTTVDDRLVAFLRLSLPAVAGDVAEIRDCALIREVHVYGPSLELGRHCGRAPQHLGLGRRLIARAAELARAAGFEDLSVISAVGTREYYRALGFSDGALYQQLSLGTVQQPAPG